MAGSRDLTRGPVRGHLVHLGAPMVVGIIAVLSISLVDAWFVGKLGLEPLAALSFTFPVVFSIASVAIGLGAGAASVVSRAIGTGDRHRVQRLATDSLLLSVLVVAALSTLGWFTIEPLFYAMGARDQVLGYIVEYMQIWYLGMPFLVVPMVANSLLRADGDSRIPSLMMIFAAIVNIGLNPIFIFGLGPIPAMGIQGAAVATVIARALSMVLALYLVFRHRLVVTGWPGWAGWPGCEARPLDGGVRLLRLRGARRTPAAGRGGGGRVGDGGNSHTRTRTHTHTLPSSTRTHTYSHMFP